MQNLNSKKVSKATIKEIQSFVYENRNELSVNMKLFYSDVVAFIDIQLKKCASQRMSMTEILERSYNIETYVLNSGACSYEVEYLEIK